MSDQQRQTAPNTSFLQLLRTSTASQHARLEALPISKMLMAETVSLANYAHYLTCMRDVIVFYENIVQPLVDDIIPHISTRKRLSGLTEDLAYLEDQGILVGETRTLQAPKIPTKAFALGMAYVIEGSTLGGRVIMKHLASRLPLTDTKGVMFFAGYGSATGTNWKQFLEGMAKYVERAECGSQVIDGAIVGFEMISNHFVKNSKDPNEH